jgi:hypothetical protein
LSTRPRSVIEIDPNFAIKSFGTVTVLNYIKIHDFHQNEQLKSRYLPFYGGEFLSKTNKFGWKKNLQCLVNQSKLRLSAANEIVILDMKIEN